MLTNLKDKLYTTAVVAFVFLVYAVAGWLDKPKEVW